MQKSQANLFIVLTKESEQEQTNSRARHSASGYAILHIIRIIKMKNNMKSEKKNRKQKQNINE